MNTANLDPINLSPEQAESLLPIIQDRFHQVFPAIKNVTPCGNQVTIEIKGEVSELENIGGNADRINNNPYTYQIIFNTGLLHHLWKASHEVVNSHIFETLVCSDRNDINIE